MHCPEKSKSRNRLVTKSYNIEIRIPRYPKMQSSQSIQLSRKELIILKMVHICVLVML